MEPQEIYSYNREEKCENKKCLEIITIILGILFFFVLGLLIGATISTTILGALAAVIVLDIILGLFFILGILYLICNRKKDKNNRKCCCCQ